LQRIINDRSYFLFRLSTAQVGAMSDYLNLQLNVNHTISPKAAGRLSVSHSPDKILTNLLLFYIVFGLDGDK
jgi:hypothetical protein